MTVYFELIYLEKPACFLNDGNEFPNQIVNHVYFTYHVYYSQANAITAMLLHNLPRHAVSTKIEAHFFVSHRNSRQELVDIVRPAFLLSD